VKSCVYFNNPASFECIVSTTISSCALLRKTEYSRFFSFLICFFNAIKSSLGERLSLRFKLFPRKWEGQKLKIDTCFVMQVHSCHDFQDVEVVESFAMYFRSRKRKLLLRGAGLTLTLPPVLL